MKSARRKATMAANADGRIIRDRPEPDGELLPTVEFLDQVLASDQRKQPPMRDASGNLVEVQVREPWELHQLTADGTNAAAEGSEKIKAPAEPVLVQLTPTGIELLAGELCSLGRTQEKDQLLWCSAQVVHQTP